MKKSRKDYVRTKPNTRSNSDMENIVRKGVELFLKEDESNAVSQLRKNGVLNGIIARVIYEPDKVRKEDIIYRKHFKE